MTIHGGDYRRAGQRSGAPLTISRLKQLLEDDVKNLTRMTGAFAQPNASSSSECKVAKSEETIVEDITDAEFDIVTNRDLLFDENWKETVQTEGIMYDIVVSHDDVLQGIGS